MLGKMAGCFLLLFLSTAAAHASDVYELNLSVARNGAAVGKATVQVIDDRDAELVITPPRGSKADAVRVLIAISQAAEQDRVGVKMKVFDRTEGEWTLRSEPSLKAKLKEEISLPIGSTETSPTAPPIELGLNVAASSRRPT
ncbi:hypothetical protein [Luteibacter sp. Lutesp34]|uniref:hypothetical protein n=1 Tax=Luteibacter sp. Lutesp34 TaxID=3243030 RepID=UPI0039B4E769